MPVPTDRLTALRAELATRGLAGFVVPLTDEHLSEYVPEYARRLAWLTGFEGSAGSAVVLADAAAIFTDGRYTIQVREQVSAGDWTFVDVPANSVTGWLADRVAAGQRIGYDPWLHDAGWVAAATAALAARGATLVAVADNPVDAVWTDRPAPPTAPLTAHAAHLSGRGSAEKRADIADWLSREGADALVLPALDSVAWLLNVRGGDVPGTPVALAYAIVHADATVDLFVAPEKVSDAVRQHLGNAVRIADRAAFGAALAGLSGRRVAVDAAAAPAAIAQAIVAAGGTLIDRRDPTLVAKATKNAVEIAGHRAASIRDGAALTRFLRWIETAGPAGNETELSAAARLRAFRAETGLLRDLSFDTISAAGAHAALPHYHVTEASDAPIRPGEIYLVDSGGQYEDATTDVTRTIAIGAPTAEMRDRFTRVLKGHIALATATFPAGTTGQQIDALARLPLWAAGLDFAHGTGHGVGSYLSVHEGPARIAKPSYPGGGPQEPLRAGMILSNEPGYYKAGAWGIRIENLVLVTEREIAGGEAPMLAFETLTLAPISREMIEPALLTQEELSWLNRYHVRVAELLAPALEGEDRAWLVSKCSAIG